MLRNKTAAYIFDMDGTLIDSEPNYAKSDCLLVKSYGGILTEKEHFDFVGIGMTEFIKIIKERYKISDTPEEIKMRYIETYLKIAGENTQVFPQMIAFVEKVRSLGYKTALASGTSLPIIKELTKKTKIDHLFDHMVSSDEVARGKPEPDVFLHTARLLNVNPHKCVVIEDSVAGMEAAVAAGMKLVAIPGYHLKDAEEEIFKKARCLFPSMEKFSGERVLNECS